MPMFTINAVNEDTDELISVTLQAEDVVDAHMFVAKMIPIKWVNYYTESENSEGEG